MRKHGPGLFCAAIVLACTCLTRYGSLDIVSFNPDESQYEAQASYLVQTPYVTFSFPFGPFYTVGVYELFAEIFGPYCMYQVRVFVALIVLLMTALIFRIVRCETNRAYALLAAVVFICFNVQSEGLSANREWFSGLPLLLSAYLFWRSGNHAPRRAYLEIFLAGVCGSWSIWMKEQSLFIVFAIPTVLVYEAIANRRLRAPLSQALCYAAGGLVGVMTGLLPLIAFGTAGDLYDYIAYGVPMYAYAEVQSPTGGSVSALYFYAFYMLMANRRLLLIVYGLTAATLVTAFWRIIRGPRQRPMLCDNRALILFVCLLLYGLLTIQTGWKFFPHYYLFITPSVAVLFALGIAHLVRLSPQKPASWGVWGGICLTYAADFLFLPSQDPIQSLGLDPRNPAVSIPAVIVAVVLGAIGFAMWRRNIKGLPQGRTPSHAKPELRGAHPLPLLLVLLLGIIGMEIAWMTGSICWMVRPAAIRLAQPWTLPSLVRYLQQQSQPKDQLFVWGWRPEIYSYSRLPAAARFGHSGYVVVDANASQDGPIVHEQYGRDLMSDLAESRPRWIVDASEISETMSRTEFHRLENFPSIDELLKREYTLAARRADCDVYVRNDDSPNSD